MEVVNKLDDEYRMPAIQREFVWSTKQICDLFDSISRSFPLGSLLFWEIKPPKVQDYAFYGFVTDFHERLNPFAMPVKPDASRPVVAVLDGQQRLTALNIGLRGSHTARRKHGRRDNLEHYTKKKLYLNMGWEESTDYGDPDEPDLFKFMSDEQAETKSGVPNLFYLVGNLHKWEEADFDLGKKLEESHNLSEHQASKGANLVNKLYNKLAIEDGLLTDTIKFDNPNHVLEAFVRLNNEGTKLSKADFLLAMATNQWEARDARLVVRELVEDLNNVGRGFAFEKAMVLKAGLAIVDAPIGFKMDNFKLETTRLIEEKWDAITAHLLTAAKLLHTFGFDEKSLPVKDAVMLPLAMYLHANDIDEKVVTRKADKPKRDAMREYVLMASLIQDYWHRRVDNILATIRNTIQSASGDTFPLEEIRSALKKANFPMEFDEESLDEVLDLEYGKRHTFPALALLIGDHLDFSTVIFHMDHVFPESKTTKTALRDQGLDETLIEEIQTRRHGLANLQLLSGEQNLGKLAAMPHEWLKEMPKEVREQAVATHELGEVPETMAGFVDWYDLRRERLKTKLEELLE